MKLWDRRRPIKPSQSLPLTRRLLRMWARGESLLGRGTLRPERVDECTTSCIGCSDVAHDSVVVHCVRIRCDVVHGCVVAVCLLGYCSHVCFGGEIAYGRALCGRSYVLTLIASVGVCRSALLVRHFIYQCPEHTLKSVRCPCCVAVWAGGVVGKSPRGCMAIPCKSSVDS